MSSPQTTSYDALPYDSYPFAETHITHLHSIAVLRGVAPKEPGVATVLEIGCGEGGNLIPMAFQYPRARFMGIDLSEAQIKTGRKQAKQLKLKNLSLEACDLREFPAERQPFDYIIAHGVFSWVGSDTQEALLQLIGTSLAPGGVAYCSYNTYPGWHFQLPLRDFLRFHDQPEDSPQARVHRARTLCQTLQQNSEHQMPQSHGISMELLAHVLEIPDWYLFHEYLEDEHHPLHFYEFERRLSGAGLQYLTDADQSTELDDLLDEATLKFLKANALNRCSDAQYRDFLTGRKLRRSLIVRSQESLQEEPSPDNLPKFLVASPARQIESPEGKDSEGGTEFELGERGSFVSYDPLMTAAFCYLQAQWPESRDFATLWKALPEELRSRENESTLAKRMLEMFRRGALRLEISAPPCVREVSVKPKASRLTRWEASRRYRITTARHDYLVLDENSRQLLSLLNGKSDMRKLFTLLGKSAKNQKGLDVPFRDPSFEFSNVSYDQFVSWYKGVTTEFARRELLIG